MNVYRVTEVIGTSAESWEDAASVARTKLNISFRYESGEQAGTGA
jgi:flavin-binding protein dodecin